MQDYQIVYFIFVGYRHYACHTGFDGLKITNTQQNVVYHPVGDVVKISDLKSNNELTEVGFTVEFSIVNERMFEGATEENLVDLPVTIHKAYLKEGETTINTNDFIISKLGNISNVEIHPDRIVVKCYTPATQLNEVTSGATRYDDVQQRTFVDGNDYGFRFADREESNSGVIYP